MISRFFVPLVLSARSAEWEKNLIRTTNIQDKQMIINLPTRPMS